MRKPPTEVSLSWMYSLVQRQQDLRPQYSANPLTRALTGKASALSVTCITPSALMSNSLTALLGKTPIKNLSALPKYNGFSHSDVAHVTKRIIDKWYTNQDTNTSTTGEPTHQTPLKKTRSSTNTLVTVRNVDLTLISV
ncbi:hypothetical protein GWK47_026775 [Chionoecetes opilio]|uniref:Uncharacterized protein n=1 Tax=Chionoecetes opilio TaxID=41210 RepID=A0A8J8WA11_CHIOP|nr:hypothetical protein GWK47_026775 [Chionoecetes opilio]